MQRLSKPFFLGSYLAGIIITILIWCAILAFGLAHIYAYTKESNRVLMVLALFASLISIYVFVVVCIFIHKAWASIQDGHVRTGPCKALGFLFIPLFNFYWIFQAIWGFAVDFNKYASRNNVRAAPRLPEGLFLAYCILTIVALIGFVLPFVVPLIGVANIVIGAILIGEVCDAVNALPSSGVQVS
jgi:hypothetical protein